MEGYSESSWIQRSNTTTEEQKQLGTVLSKLKTNSHTVFFYTLNKTNSVRAFRL